jgi:hypothetical protein
VLSEIYGNVMPDMILFGNLWEGMIFDPGFYSWDIFPAPAPAISRVYRASASMASR